jgi:rhamnopyranosyl-N-acetylglucosaminyl-diphospho-decaprenol beta-1,3/1,4-galactofuranosyltransferase
MGTRVVAVVVTYNRRELLAEALDALGAQTRPQDLVIVVDNASTDGTAGLVRERFSSVELVELPRNTGGAGGFAVGIARAQELDADLIWLMDDDTIPAPTALEELLAARGDHAAALVASRVVWTDGRDHPMNTPRPKPLASRTEKAAAQAAGCVPIRSASFVSVLVDAAVVQERGLPVADYFLWNDDFEFTTRLLRGRLGLYCPKSVVVHKTRTFGSTDADPGPRFFYEVRNKIWLFTRSRGLTPAERLLYGGSTLRRWARTYARSGDRAALRQEFRRGVSAGLRTRPRATAELLRELKQ